MNFDDQISIDDIIQEMLRCFGDEVADPEVFPKIFLFQAKIARQRLLLKKKENDPPPTDTK